jgi:predicted PurR-regulated permease PerM
MTTFDPIESPALWRQIAAGGCAIVGFTALLALIWYAASTLFLLFAGILFGVFLTALSDLLKRVIGGGPGLRLIIVVIMFVAAFGTFLVLYGTTIADQAALLATTVKSQVGTVKDFLDRHGVDTSFLDVSALTGTETMPSTSPHLPNAGALASGTSTVLSQSLKILAGLFSTVGNIFIVLLLGVLLASQPQVYRDGVLRFFRAPQRTRAAALFDDLGETLRRWLLGQLVTMTTIAIVVSIGLSVIGIPGALALGIQTGLLTFIPTVGGIIAGAIIVLASLGSGWAALFSAFGLYLVVQLLEGNVLTPLIQRRAIEIPPATIFGAQILLAFLFGIWGLALTLPLIATIKVVLRHIYRDDAEAAPATG